MMFVKKLYQNGLPNFQVSVLNATWLQQQQQKNVVPCSSVTGRFHCTTMIIMKNVSLIPSVMITNELKKLGTEKDHTHIYTVCNKYCFKVNKYKSSE